MSIFDIPTDFFLGICIAAVILALVINLWVHETRVDKQERLRVDSGDSENKGE